MQEAAQQAHTDRLTAVADEQRRQQALQDQLITARLTENLGQAQAQHQAELSLLRASSDEQLNRAQVEHAALMNAADAELQQTKLSLREVIVLISMNRSNMLFVFDKTSLRSEREANISGLVAGCMLRQNQGSMHSCTS